MERQPKRKKGESGPEFATAIFPQSRDGEPVPCVIISSSQEAKEALREDMERHGIVFVKPREKGRAVFGFGGVKWNGGWEPTGPKPNWTTSSNPIKN